MAAVAKLTAAASVARVEDAVARLARARAKAIGPVRVTAQRIEATATTAGSHLEDLPQVARPIADRVVALLDDTTIVVAHYAALEASGVLDVTLPGVPTTSREHLTAVLVHLDASIAGLAEQVGLLRASSAASSASARAARHPVEWTPEALTARAATRPTQAPGFPTVVWLLVCLAVAAALVAALSRLTAPPDPTALSLSAPITWSIR